MIEFCEDCSKYLGDNMQRLDAFKICLIKMGRIISIGQTSRFTGKNPTSHIVNVCELELSIWNFIPEGATEKIDD